MAFKTFSVTEKIVTIATVMTSLAAILGYIGLSLPRPVWAGEFLSLKHEIYTNRLDDIKDELRDIKIQEYQLQQTSVPVPSFIIEEKLKLEDDVKVLENKIDKIEEQIEE